MPDPSVTVALLVLVALVEASPLVRLPIGLLLAIALLAAGAQLLPVALVGAAGVTLARLWLAIAARMGRDRFGSSSAAARGRREAMRRQLAGSLAYARMTFMLAAMPAVPAGFLFPLLGAMRAPLWPALAGTLVGRTPLLALTTAIFAWLGRLSGGGDHEGALALGIFAALLLAIRTVGLVDWQHRAQTGQFRMRDADEHAALIGSILGPGTARNAARGARRGTHPTAVRDDDEHEIVEGELIGEESDADHDDASGGEDGDDPPSLPPSGLAPS